MAKKAKKKEVAVEPIKVVEPVKVGITPTTRQPITRKPKYKK